MAPMAEADDSNQVDKGAQGDFFSDNFAANADSYLKPKITVFGVGGAGGNAVNNMIKSNLEGVDFVVANTDAQALLQSMSEKRIQLGLEITSGLGAGARPDVGRVAAEEVIDEIVSYIKNSNMVFITAGMGGGTGTGAAPVIARMAKEHGVLTIGVITKPFHFEGTTRMRIAERGIDELQQFVDTLIIIPNQNLFRVANEKTTFADAFKMADNVLRSGVQGVTDLMVMPGLINLDFADIRTVMSEMGKAMMGTGDAEGDRRAIEAAEAAISNPLLDDVSMKGAKGILINITGGYDMTLYEVDEAANRIREEVDPDANIIFGSTFNEKMNGRMRVSVVATGIDAAAVQQKIRAFEEMNFSKISEKDSGNGYGYGQYEKNLGGGAQPGGIAAMSSGENVVPLDPAAGNGFVQQQSLHGQNIANGGYGAGINVISGNQPGAGFSDSGKGDMSTGEMMGQKKKSPSLFERLTGMKRPFSSGSSLHPSAQQEQKNVNEFMVQQKQSSPQPTQPQQFPSPEENLEIPAFLRRS
ncbi:MAG: cell division protein FtsZ [Holosporaceae bacterium]|jgi:cell division protein FtsZ|nr:cell division protein FtsZ [Holosporaceae bacterium]